MQFEVKTLPETHFVVKEKRTTLATMGPFIDEATPEIWSLKESGAIDGSGTFTFFYKDSDGQPDTEFALRIGMSIESPSKLGSSPASVQDDLFVKTLNEHQVAATEFRGSIADLPTAWAKFTEAVTQQGHQPMNKCREIYHQWAGPDSAENVIEFQIPLARDGNQ
jgi:effector-binding domain-containing protein